MVHHNGDKNALISLPSSTGLIKLLNQFERESNGSKFDVSGPFRDTAGRRSVDAEPWSRFSQRLFSRWSSSNASSAAPPRPLPTLTPEASILLPAFTTIAKSLPPNVSDVGLSLPPFITNSQVSHFFTAARHADLDVRDLAHSSSALAPSTIDLCRIPSDYLPCDPQRIMTLDLGPDRLTATSLFVHENMDIYESMQYQVSHSLGRPRSDGEIPEWRKGVTAFIDSFVEPLYHDVTKLHLLGPEARNPSLVTAVLASTAAKSLQDVSEDPKYFEALGMARLTKQRMEEQDSDCIEDQICQRVREEADRIAGQPRWRGSVESSERMEL